MLFAGLTSAYIVLRGTPGWEAVPMPPVLWGDTVVLLASSISIEFARRSVRKNRLAAMNQWLVVSGILGFAFLVGQVIAWRQLVDAGVYLQSTLHSSFLFVLTSVHGIHLLGGIVALLVVLGKARIGYLTAADHEPLALCATYWHFMDVLWVYLFLLLILA
jgi:cytochrome c oxidase subunit 3